MALSPILIVARMSPHYAYAESRSVGYENERHDCTVRALSIATELPYKVVHARLRIAGRKDGHGFRFAPFMACNHRFGNYTSRHLVDIRGETLGQFLKSHSVGRFVIRKRGHAFAVVDGIVIDRCPAGLRSIVKDVWKFELCA